MDSEGTVNLPVKGGKHFKEVSMGGFGGSMKNIAIGCADGRIGKREVHGVADENAAWSAWPGKELLMENMAESAKAVCDCAGRSAAEPTIPDIGILASTDILAIDQASVDLV